MPKFLLRVDDVGRKPGDTPEHGTDGDLSYFFEWRERGAFVGVPIFYGVVPKWVPRSGIVKAAACLSGGERFAVHGFDHRKGAVVTYDQMKEAVNHLDMWPRRLSVAYIPPFNSYNIFTIRYWTECFGELFFGGFDGEHHKLGKRPQYISWPTIGRCIHLNAEKSLYGRAPEILANLPQVQNVDYPLVITLHVPWDTDFAALRELRDTIADDLIGFEELREWMDSTGGG